MTVTLREACRRLETEDRNYIKGLVDGLGIRLQPVGNALCMSEPDYKRLKRAYERLKLVAA